MTTEKLIHQVAGSEKVDERAAKRTESGEYQSRYDNNDALATPVSSEFSSLEEEAYVSAFEAEVLERIKPIIRMLGKKNYAYGNDNIIRFGETGVTVRLSDKVSRLWRLLSLKVDESGGESRLDSWNDAIGYSIIGSLLNSGTWLHIIEIAQVSGRKVADNKKDSL